jgi:hypothetical protein
MQISLCSFLHFQVTHETENAEAIKFKHHRACTAILVTYHRRSAYIPCNKLYFYSRQESTSCFQFLGQLALLYLLQTPPERIIDKSVYEYLQHTKIKLLTKRNYLITEQMNSQNEVHHFKNLQYHVTVQTISIDRVYKTKNLQSVLAERITLNTCIWNAIR